TPQKGSTGWWFSPPKAPHTTQKQVFADLSLISLSCICGFILFKSDLFKAASLTQLQQRADTAL
ncbi:hypothetical protein, partial [Escherichia coli]|uniref:hypothetical protein n=3 Tax=Escherichia coli TaxID=562 RepID=UPI001BD3C432